VEESNNDARQVAALRKTLADSVAGANFLTDKKRSNPLTVALLDDLSRRLPEDTYLERLQIDGGKAQLQGQSKEAAKLIALIAASDCLANPSLQGQIQPDPRTGKERFQITADVKSCSAPASGANPPATPAHEAKAAAAHANAPADNADKKEPPKAAAPKKIVPPKSAASKPVSPPKSTLVTKPNAAPPAARAGAMKPKEPVSTPPAMHGNEKTTPSTAPREAAHGDH
jgi:general secretion pathway protein L